MNNLNRKFGPFYLVQNLTSFLVYPFIFVQNHVLRVKNANKEDPWKIFTSKHLISDRSTLFAFFTLKTRFSAKKNRYTRKLVKFWTRYRSQTFLFIFLINPLRLIWNLKRQNAFFQCIFQYSKRLVYLLGILFCFFSNYLEILT